MFQSHSAVGDIVQQHVAAPSVKIDAAIRVSDSLFRVVASVVNTPDSKTNRAAVLASLDKKLGGKLRAVHGSFKSVNSTPVTETITGLVTLNRRVVAVTEENAEGFRAVASNMFMDEEQNMWTLRRSQAGDLMIQSQGIDDIVEIEAGLQSLCSSHHATGLGMVARCSSKELNTVGEGHFVAFVDDQQQTRFGFVIASLDVEQDGQIVDSGKVLVAEEGVEGTEQVDRLAIVDSVSPEGLESPELTEDEVVQQSVSASRGTVNVEQLIRYYTKVYGHNKAFLSQFISRIRGHAFCC